MFVVLPTTTRHGVLSARTRRVAASLTGLRAASSAPVSCKDSKAIASSPVSTEWRCPSVSARDTFPSMSVLRGTASMTIGAPGIGVSSIVRRKVIVASGGVGVTVGVTVAVGVTVGVGVIVKVEVGV